MDATAFDALCQRQQNLEDNALALGSQRFRHRLEVAAASGKASTVGAARKLLQTAIEPLEKAIVDDLMTPKRGRPHMARKWIEAIGADVAAYMTVKVVLDGVGRRQLLRKSAFAIAELIVDELRYRRFQEQAPELFRYRMGKFTTSSYSHMARSLDAAMNYAKVDTTDLELTNEQRLMLGAKLIDLFLTSTGLMSAETVTTRRGRTVHRDTYLIHTPETLAWLHARNDALEFLWPVNLPMIVPPLPWGPRQRGGYRYAMRAKHAFVRGVSKLHAQTLDQTEMPAVYEAVNRIQETAWRINPAVLALVETIAQRGGGLAGVPDMNEDPLPAKPHDIAENEEARRQWRRAAALVRDRNHTRKAKALEFSRTLSTAQSVATEDAIFFPMNLDFRGRVYPIVNYLTPQGDDLSKALLTFAQAKPLGEDGSVWLAIHGANCLGKTAEGVKLSKATLQERVDWIVAHTVEIEQAAADPLVHTWWAKADDPLQFFAFCVEWAAFAKLERAGRGAEYSCSLPVAMDGTCNGLQHFAAMLRDDIGGAAVNVVPQERPEDIYQRVADRVLTRLEAAAADEPLARVWLTSRLVDRSLTKRPTMTFGYGSKRFGFTEQLVEYLKGHEEWKTLAPLFTAERDGKTVQLVRPAAQYMSGLIWESLRDIVVAAFYGMAWMQKAARAVVASGKCVEWRVPGTGFPVRQEYMRFTLKKIATTLAGRLCRPRVANDTNIPNPVKQANAVSPNFVHSMDAAALMLTVAAASAEGVESFGMVHDSYATLAADAGVLARCTRETFYQLYSRHDVIEEFAAQLRAQAKKPDEFPEPPEKGNLDLGGVLVSEYFFS